MKNLLMVLLMLPLCVFAQSKKEKKAIAARMQAQQESINRIKAQVQFLSNSQLQGSTTSTDNIQTPYDYISNEFRNIGLEPKGTEGFLQPFVVEEGKKIDPSTHFSIDDHKLLVGKEFIPLPYSANKAATGSPALDLREKGEPWFADIKDWINHNESKPAELHQHIIKEVERVAAKGASGLILYNSGSHPDNITFDKFDTTPTVGIPVVYMPFETFKLYCHDAAAIYDIDFNVKVDYAKVIGRNVIGFIDNGAASTVVIGAHYDQLNGTQKNTADSLTYNAAGNASGTAGLLELARTLKNSVAKKNNYLFIAFSAGGVESIGSKYWLEHSVGISNINYMVNLDKIGTYDEAGGLTIVGANTSTLWNKLLSVANNNSVKFIIDSTHIHRGDHDPFIGKEIPALHFYTDNRSNNQSRHEGDPLNFEGEYKIINLVMRVLESADTQGKIAFNKPIIPTTNPSSRFTVSLGVIPDNSYKGKGFKIGGVTPKRLADKIGLKPGDILLQLGDFEIKETSGYTQALSMFKQGDTTLLKILRGTNEKNIQVIF